MKLSEVILSYPFVRYDVDVTHFTARYSTAIEWLILETIQKISNLSGISVNDHRRLLFFIVQHYGY